MKGTIGTEMLRRLRIGLLLNYSWHKNTSMQVCPFNLPIHLAPLFSYEHYISTVNTRLMHRKLTSMFQYTMAMRGTYFHQRACSDLRCLNKQHGI